MTVEDVWQPGTLFACGQALLEQQPVAVQINDAHLRPATGQEVAIAALERGAGDHTARAEPAAAVDPRRYLLEPRPLIAGIERMDGPSLRGRWRMELVAFLQRPAESLGEGCCDGRLPASRDAHDNEDCVRVKGSHERNVGRHAPFDHKMPCLGRGLSNARQAVGRCRAAKMAIVSEEA